MASKKRKFSIGDSELQTPPGTPSSWSSDGSARMTKVQRLFGRPQNRRWTPAKQPDDKMSEMLEFILAHEEAFKSKGRLASLFSDFRVQLSSNPDGYYANINAWKKALADAARAGVIQNHGHPDNLLSLKTGEGLMKALTHNQFGRPTCFGPVAQDALSKKEWIPLTDFLSSKTSIYNRGWIPSPWTIMQWGLRKVGALGSPNGDSVPGGDFVIVTNVETAANLVLNQVAQKTSSIDMIFSRKDFLEELGSVLNPAAKLTHSDLNILLTHLNRDRQAVTYDEHTIKFKPDGQAKPDPIGPEDKAITQVRDAIKTLNKQIQPLHDKIAELDATARFAVAAKQLVRAKGALRQKKHAEKTLQIRNDTLLQLEEVYAQIQQAADQVEIVEALKASSTALKGLNQRVGGAEGVQKVMDELSEQTADAEEISRIINESGQPIDETEVDEEFAALEQQEKEKKEKEEAARTAARLAELEQAEKERKEKESAEKTTDEPQVENASQGISELSIQPEGSSKEEHQEERVPIPA